MAFNFFQPVLFVYGVSLFHVCSGETLNPIKTLFPASLAQFAPAKNIVSGLDVKIYSGLNGP